jgi:hypothetical protein
MCTRFVYNGNDTIIGFNFDIDISEYEHKVFLEKERFFIGIKMPDNQWHSYHGVNANGNVGTLLYVHGNERALKNKEGDCYTIAELTERFVCGGLSFEEAVEIAQEKEIIYENGATMQALLSDKNGRVLIVEPGIGYKTEMEKFSLITNYSLLSPQSTQFYITLGDNRYECAKELLNRYDENFSVAEAFSVLKEVKQEGLWATRVSFVYSVNSQTVYYIENNQFDEIKEWKLSKH